MQLILFRSSSDVTNRSVPTPASGAAKEMSRLGNAPVTPDGLGSRPWLPSGDYPDPSEDVLMRVVSSDAATVVEVIHLSATETSRDGGWYRLRRGQWHVADVRCVAELVSLGIELADLRDVG
jgi:hypothetical protein